MPVRRPDLRETARSLRRAEVRTDLVQVLKTVVAAVGAWGVAALWLGLDQPFLAPWAALLTVHATVVRTFWRGAQSVLATFLGLVLSFLAVLVLGYGLLTLTAALLVGLLLARLGGLRTEGLTVATTALFVLTAGYGQQELLLAQRFLDTLIGVGAGLLVNVLVVPPLDDRLAEKQLDRVTARLGALLQRMAEDLSAPASEENAEEWMEETRVIDAGLDRAEELLRFTWESQRWNLRRNRSASASDPEVDQAALHRLEDAVSQARVIARVVGRSVTTAEEWDPRFRDPWLELLDEVGRRVAAADIDLHGLRERIVCVMDDLSSEDLPSLRWPVYGTLLYALLTVVDVVADVDTAIQRSPGLA